MKTKRGRKSRLPITAFWDASALEPLCAQARQEARTYSRQVVWWGDRHRGCQLIKSADPRGYVNR